MLVSDSNPTMCPVVCCCWTATPSSRLLFAILTLYYFHVVVCVLLEAANCKPVALVWTHLCCGCVRVWFCWC